MRVRIHPFFNGYVYKWNKLKSLFDFFFPYTKNGKFEYIRREAGTDALLENGKLTVKRDFYTFRAFFWHYTYTLLINPIKTIWLRYLSLFQLRLDLLAFLILGNDPKFFPLVIGAIAFDVASDGSTAGTSLTVAHTCTGSNLELVTMIRDNSAGTTNVTGATYNAVSMTKENSVENPSTTRAAYLFDLSAPATGANNIVVSITTGGSTRALSYSYSGVKQTLQPDAKNTASVTSTSCGVTMTSSDANGWAVCCYMNAEADHNSATNIVYRSGSGGTEAGDTNGVIGSTSPVTYTFGYPISVNDAICGVVYIPAAVAGGPTIVAFKTLLGVGQT